MLKTFRTKLITMMLGAILLMGLISVPAHAAKPKVALDPTNPGSWSAPLNCPGFNPIHAAMLPSGNVFAMAGSGYNRERSEALKNGEILIDQAWTWNPDTPTQCPTEVVLPAGVDLFCAGMVHLPDGRLLVFGGTDKYGEPNSYLGSPNYYTGIRDTYVFDEDGNTFTKLDDMDVARWYGTGVIKMDGQIDVFGGLGANAEWTQNHQRFNPATMQWTTLPTPPWKMPMYAGSALLQNNQIAYTGTYFGSTNGVNPMMWNPDTNSSTAIPGLSTPQCRDQGNTLFIVPKIYVIGGGCSGTGATSAVSMLDVSKQPLQFTTHSWNSQAGMHQCAATLPDKSIFVSHGTNHNDKATATLAAKRLAPNGTTWQALAAPTVKRGYHSTCLTLMDGRVLTMGTNWDDGTVETRLEIYNPWYTQPGYVRPTMLNLGVEAKASCDTLELPVNAKIAGTYGVASPVAITLSKIDSVTHQHDPNNRLVTIPVTKTAEGKFSFIAPAANSPVVPKGQYKMSLLDWRGAPSVSQMVSVGGAGCCC